MHMLCVCVCVFVCYWLSIGSKFTLSIECSMHIVTQKISDRDEDQNNRSTTHRRGDIVNTRRTASLAGQHIWREKHWEGEENEPEPRGGRGIAR